MNEDDVLPENDGVQEPGAIAETPPNPTITVSENLRQEVADALVLLDFVVSTGFKSVDGTALPTATLTGIKMFAALITPRGDQKPDSMTIPSSAWVEFELNYMALTLYTAPVTVETLRNTAPRPLARHSDAQRFARILWGWTGAFVIGIIIIEWALDWYGPGVDGNAGYFNTVLQLGSIVQPYLYGGLGACAYLLRSAHTFIYQRSFDLRREPEYFNRILLGSVSGGAIILFIDTITTDSEDTVQLSSAALGFIAGYSNDFLFNTIERVMNAILPKVGIATVAQRQPRASQPIDIDAGGLTLKDLLDRYQSAQGADRDLYKGLIDKLSSKL
ncbi:hypothetical protein [Rhizobium terrae]|uniref:hypothetical protein n=1 Tax=Rhizobium terrae TaxID=2171756 RepID=UPI000E3D34E1|nr:hypothetical protein [Rhizobium terrae]